MAVKALKLPADYEFVQQLALDNNKEALKHRITGHLIWNPLMTNGFPWQKSINAESFSM